MIRRFPPPIVPPSPLELFLRRQRRNRRNAWLLFWSLGCVFVWSIVIILAR